MGKSDFKRKLSTAMNSNNLKFAGDEDKKYDSTNLPDLTSISCSLCMAIAFNPVVCHKCDNLFCEECLKSFIAEVKACPIGCAEPTYSKASEEIISRVKQ